MATQGKPVAAPEVTPWVFETSLGRLRISATPEALVEIKFHATDPIGEPSQDVAASALCRQAKQEIEAYLGGGARYFSVPHEAQGSNFQRRVWQLLEQIPYAATVTYGDLAQRLQAPGASRAVGLACGANPLPLVIPCHRVLAKDGWGGFAGGLAIKRRLLDIEASADGKAIPRQGSLPF